MSTRDLLPQVTKYTLGKGAVADGTAETVTAVIDMADFDEVEFEVNLGDVDAAAVLTFAVKENTANSTSSPTPTTVPLTEVASGLGAITNGALVITEADGNLDNKTILIAVTKQAITKRYVFLSITVADESYEVASIGVRQRRARKLPVTQSASVASVALGYA